MARFLALLRAVNVGGRKVPMADLRALAAEIGLANPTTFIASGNLLFDAEANQGDLEAKIESALQSRFGFAVPTMVCSSSDWHRNIAANPFPAASADRPNLVMLALSKQALKPDAAEALQERATCGERVAAAGGVLWIDYVKAIGTSKLTPNLIDRAAGSPVTTRNWRSALKLGELLEHGS